MPASSLSKERLSEINTQIWKSGVIGGLKGTLVGLVTGYYFSYKHNHGHNQRFFLTPYKIWYLMTWGIVGLAFSAETARGRVIKDLAEEENIRRDRYFLEGLEGKSP